MPNYKELLEKLNGLFSKLDTTRKILLGVIAAVIVIALFFVVNVSSSTESVALYSKLEAQDFAKITGKLTELGYKFSTKGTEAIFINPQKREEILMVLAQENMIPSGVPGWELFDMDKWSETQFEKDIKQQRAVMGAITKTLSTLKSVESAQVNIAFPSQELFKDDIQPVTAAVVVNYAPGIEKLTRKEIKGIETLVARSVPRLKNENVTISGPDGEIINDFDDEIDQRKWELQEVERKLKIQERERVKLLSDISNSLQYAFGDERADVVRLDIKLRWDKEVIEKNEVSPVVMVEDNPLTPYSEREVKDSLEVSSKVTTETFEGNGFTPEGPVGTEPNIPPGYKDKDYQKANYQKAETIRNNKFNETHRKIEKQPWELEKVNLAVILDGKWAIIGENEAGTGYKREYTPVSDEELKNITDVLKKAIGYDLARGDQISVRQIQKDRSKEFAEADALLVRQKNTRRMLIASLLALLAIAVLWGLYTLIKKELDRRRRQKEEELAAKQQMMREAAIRAWEEEGVEVELSPEERARREMLENAINLAKEKPEEVAQLIRTWLSED